MPHENVDKRKKSHGRAQKKKVHPRPKGFFFLAPKAGPGRHTAPPKKTKPDPRRRSHK